MTRAPSPARIELASPRLDPAAAELGVELAAEVLAETRPGELVALVALFESGLATEVTAGENARRRLENDYVVRLLRPAFRLAGEPGAAPRERLTLALDPDWRTENLGLAALLQDPRSLAILAASVRTELEEPGR